jgi:hypothetical protein
MVAIHQTLLPFFPAFRLAIGRNMLNPRRIDSMPSPGFRLPKGKSRGCAFLEYKLVIPYNTICSYLSIGRLPRP